MSTQCQLASVMVEVDGDIVADLIVPAYSESAPEIHETILALFWDYVRESEEAGSKLSISDFAMLMLAYAATQPHEIPDERG